LLSQPTTHLIIFLLPLFFFNASATTDIYTLSLHDALPISALKAGIAQLVEHDLAKFGVAISSLVSRSSFTLFFNDFGAIAKRLCTGLQIHVGRFDSGSRLQDFGDPTLRRTAWQEAPVVKLVDTRDLK